MSNIELSRNKRIALPVAALAATAMAGAGTSKSEGKQLSVEATPKVRMIESFNWLNRINWSKELKAFIPILHLKPEVHHKRNHGHRHLTSAQMAARLVSPKERMEWNETNDCEEPNDWSFNNNITVQDTTVYSGGFAMEEANWVADGGLEYAESPGRATPDEQIVVARRLLYPETPISNARWARYGGRRFSSTYASATRDERNAIEESIAPRVPEQNGDCTGW